MPNMFESQKQGLVYAINSFEPFVNRIHADYKNGKFHDWPTIVLVTTLQATAISIFRLLSSSEHSDELLDRRSIATLVRNIVDTHDAFHMLVNASTHEEYQLHRDILGLYLSSRIHKVQSSINPQQVQELYLKAPTFYWDKIQQSSLYNKSNMGKLKRGEQIFYRSREERVEDVCGTHSRFVLAILADLSTYAHSIPPGIWFSDLTELYADNRQSRDLVAVWLQLTNFYFARIVKGFLRVARYEASPNIDKFLLQFQAVFASASG